ncbi:MAG: redox-regulated ATPase YchF [Candidatus Omnitrophota bacterium]|nr:redox-regulated ATPase YchF [Candidatus Omnitrophota bacterium]
MKIGIIGLPQVGKKTIFGLLTGVEFTDAGSEKLKSAVKGMVTVRDPRFDNIAGIYSSVKKTPAHIDVALMPKIDREYIKNGHLFEHLDDADAICHIVRAFKDDAVYHVNGSVAPERDIDSVNTELILSDLMFAEKRLERMDKESKKKREGKGEKEKALLLKFRQQLEKELPLRILELDEEERKMISSYSFVTLKPVFVVLNTGESDLRKEVLDRDLIQKYRSRDIYITQVSAKIESELARLESEEDKIAFLKELEIDEPAIDKLTRLLYQIMGLISFFTAANKEVRAWTIKEGSTAPQAARAIHSDMEKGFIRAEVIKYDDLVKFGSENKVKEAGRLMVKGKDYVVCDGDILNIRFNV